MNKIHVISLPQISVHVQISQSDANYRELRGATTPGNTGTDKNVQYHNDAPQLGENTLWNYTKLQIVYNISSVWQTSKDIQIVFSEESSFKAALKHLLLLDLYICLSLFSSVLPLMCVIAFKASSTSTAKLILLSCERQHSEERTWLLVLFPLCASWTTGWHFEGITTHPLKMSIVSLWGGPPSVRLRTGTR